MISTAWLLIGRKESERMSRLIDADMTRNWITEDWFLDVLLSCVSKSVMKDCLLNVIDSIPLAYDVDNVVEQLEEIENYHLERIRETNRDEELRNIHKGRAYGTQKAIAIVKAGETIDIMNEQEVIRVIDLFCSDSTSIEGRQVEQMKEFEINITQRTQKEIDIIISILADNGYWVTVTNGTLDRNTGLWHVDLKVRDDEE